MGGGDAPAESLKKSTLPRLFDLHVCTSFTGDARLELYSCLGRTMAL